MTKSELTPCQREVFDLIGQGLTPPEIAERMSRTVSAVRQVMHRICESKGISGKYRAERLYSIAARTMVN